MILQTTLFVTLLATSVVGEYRNEIKVCVWVWSFTSVEKMISQIEEKDPTNTHMYTTRSKFISSLIIHRSVPMLFIIVMPRPYQIPM